MRGLKLHGVPTREMAEAAEELGIPILMHPPRVGLCKEIVESFPLVNFILAHRGSFASRDWREHGAAIELAGTFPNLHLETSSVVFHPFLERAAKDLPPEKVNKIRLLGLPATTTRMVFAGNITRLLGGKL